MPRPLTIALAVFACSTLACTCSMDEELMAEFQAAKAEALADPPKADADWAPDAALHLSRGLLDELVGLGLEGHGPWKGKLDVGGGVVLTPKVNLEDLSLAPAKGCDTCIAANVTLDGTLKYKAGILGTGKVPMTIKGDIDVALDNERKGNSWVVTARVHKVRNLELTLQGLPRAVVKPAEQPLQDWAEEELKGLEPTVITQIGGKDLPARELRVVPEGAAVRIELLTEAVVPGTVPRTAPKITEGWQLDVANSSLVWLARTAAFELGPQTMDIVAVPEGLEVKRSRFELDLRLWRVAPPGWWRDYTVTGKVRVGDGSIDLVPASAEQTAASPGAGMADPLAVLAEGLIVDSMVTVLEQSVPADESTTVEGWKADVAVTKVLGSADGRVVQVQGTLELSR